MPTQTGDRMAKLLEVLEERVPVMTLDQAAQTWWTRVLHPLQQAHTAVSRRAARGDLFLHQVEVVSLAAMCSDSVT